MLAGVLNFSTTATQTSNVGSYPLLAGGLASANYTISYVSSTLAVVPEAITFTAINKSRKFKAGNPKFLFTVSGLVLGQSAKSVYSGSPTLSTRASKNSPAGQYAIVVNQGKLRLLNSNYTFAFVEGVLQVTGGTVKKR